jgi:hypothetical protein
MSPLSSESLPGSVQPLEWNTASTPRRKQTFKKDPAALLALRKQAEYAMSTAFPLLIKESVAQEQTTEYMRQQIVNKINNQELAAELIPDFALGCWRLTVSFVITSVNPPIHSFC